MSGEAHLGVVVFRAQNDVRDIAQPEERAFVLTDDELLELIRGVQIRVRGQIYLKQRTFGAANRGQVIVSRKGIPDIGRADIQRRHPFRLHPDTHGESAAAKDVRLLHAADRCQPGLNKTNHIIGHLVRL